MKRVNINNQKKSLICLAIGLALSNGAFADEISTEEVVVWGTKVSSSSESIGTDDLAIKQADHMSDLLRDIPGVDVGGTHSLNQRINIRGFDETDIDIRLDGASQHANMFHHIGNLTLNPDILKSADIQVGNNSVAQNGLAGAVYFETKDGKDLLNLDEKFGVRLHAGYATNASQQGSVTAYGQLTEQVDTMLYSNYVSNGNTTDGAGTENFGAEGDIKNTMVKVGFDLSPIHRFEFAYDFYHDEGDYSARPDMNGEASEYFTDVLLPTVYDRNTITLNYELNTEKHSGKVSLYSTETEIERDETETGWTGRDSVNTATNNNTGLNATFQSELSVANLNNQLTYGLDYINQTSSSAYDGIDYMEESTKSTGIFIENKIYITDALSITTGLRYDDYRRYAETSKTDYNDVTWSLGSDWKINNNWSIFANTRSLFKGPELIETFVQDQYTAYLADDIKAETGMNTQVGFSYNELSGAHRYGVNFTVFKTDIDDYIVETYASDYSYLTIENSGDVETKGFELSSTYSYEQFSGKLAYAKSDSEYSDSGLAVNDGDNVSTDMGDSIALTVNYYLDSIDTLFGWNSTFVLEEDNVLDGASNKAAYNVHNFYAQWLPADMEALSVTFGIDNIFDEEYVSHASRTGLARGITTDDYEPGRNVKLSVAYQF
ncbi:TonB-dependent siderophore receptor [Psychromonas algicola]|uniref:TonB-dependent siderophore receptor n=1 Tax=Psychromonas algicola TaxID=2555642 RepID=UPI001067994A|nr:TonB-dependent siderophore receptor [Psychromonas sp. RZ5]TEW47266.1 TonB-dependent siderophore receptor [Psychromonas sp. RZ5]